MTWTTTRSFDTDYRNLTASEAALFRKALKTFVPACERFVADPSGAWPASLRVRQIVSAPGIWEMTWSFAGPDGRATFEFIRVDGSPAVRWRRIGSHAIFKDA